MTAMDPTPIQKATAIWEELVAAVRDECINTLLIGVGKYPRYDPADTVLPVEFEKIRRHLNAGIVCVSNNLPPVDDEGNNNFTADIVRLMKVHDCMQSQPATKVTIVTPEEQQVNAS